MQLNGLIFLIFTGLHEKDDIFDYFSILCLNSKALKNNEWFRDKIMLLIW